MQCESETICGAPRRYLRGGGGTEASIHPAELRRHPALHRSSCSSTGQSSSKINDIPYLQVGSRLGAISHSAVDAVISKRFAKRQRMQWTKRGAHLLLQIRTRALNGMLRQSFERWYPGLANDNTAAAVQAAVHYSGTDSR